MYSHTKHRLNKAILTEKGIDASLSLMVWQTHNSKQLNLIQAAFFNAIIKTTRLL
jgi:hypothetical protein